MVGGIDEVFRDFERRVEKWCKEHIPRKETDPISEKGQNLIDDTDRWWDQESLLRECYESRKRERVHEDGSFMNQQKGPITTTYTSNWFLRELFIELMDPQNHERKESNKCDLYKDLWIVEN